ncbi:MAG TPA: tRNA preQ1(34) S-adenosylmethionine ribosyltransferase-isomerase QueA [Casimicrobiaceae bacterium]|nr:tRNA preQ1(34) S-adenosylmethionine ribosyltransferase-isomerase QueA [Casimicrobiaceae bacterium]
MAQHPAATRTASRLLHVEAQKLTDLTFTDLPDLIGPHDVLVFNDTRVIPARLHARKTTGGQVELLVERILADDEALVQLRASHPPGAGALLHLAGGATATVLSRDERWYRLRFANAGPLPQWIEQHGSLPLPPYITHAPDTDDAERYQTVYARHAGAVAAPTAGLHFDRSMLDELARRGIQCVFLTLHVGAGTFQPVQDEDIGRHRMHAERYTLPAEVGSTIAAARERGGRVVAVGTTSLRALEAAADGRGGVVAGSGETALFITPGYRFRVVDRLLTNFHLPRSTLLMLVSAFAGHATILHAYAHAVERRYRFFSYGDAMLIERAPA